MRNAMKRFLSFILLFVVSLVAVGFTTEGDVKAATSYSILNHPKGHVASSTTYADAKYSFIPIKTSSTKMTYFGVTPKKNKNGVEMIVNPSTSLKGKFGVTYSHIGKYNGRWLNLKITVMDWSVYAKSNPFMVFTEYLGFAQEGYHSVKLNWKFVYDDTGKDATDLPGWYFTAIDFDGYQTMAFDSAGMNSIVSMYATSDTKVKYFTKNGKTHVGSVTADGTTNYDKFAWVTFLLDGYSLTFDWCKDWSYRGNSDYFINLDSYDGGSFGFGQFFGYTSEKLIPTKPSTPTKKIRLANSTLATANTINVTDDTNSTFTYEIYHRVPHETSSYYYSGYVFEDTINSAFKINSVKIYNTGGTDVTSRFTIKTDNNKVTATLNSSWLKNASTYNQEYTFKINVSLNLDKVSANTYFGTATTKTVDNTATIKVTRNNATTTLTSNKVTTTLNYTPIPVNNPTKTADVSEVDVTIPDTSFHYTVSHKVPAIPSKRFYYNTYRFQDTIHNAFVIKSVKVLDGSNNDVSSLFDIKVDGNKITATAKPSTLATSSFYNKTYRLKVNVTPNITLDDAEALFGKDEFAKDEPRLSVKNTAYVTVDSKELSASVDVLLKIIRKLEVGLQKVQIYTDKASDGLPIAQSFYHKVIKTGFTEENLVKNGQIVTVTVTDKTNNKTVYTKDYKLQDLYNADWQVDELIPKEFLTKNSKANYKVELSLKKGLDVKLVQPSIELEGYTAQEKELVASNGNINFTGVSMVEREFDKDMVKKNETISVQYTPTLEVKSGYGFPLDSKLVYKNDVAKDKLTTFGILTEVDAKASVVKALIDRTDIQDDTMTFDLIKSSMQVKSSPTTEVNIDYSLSDMYLDRITGHMLINDEEVRNATSAIRAGRKIYIPIWIDNVGSHDNQVVTTKPLGSHHMTLKLPVKVNVIAYMFNHIDSPTFDLDEILIEPKETNQATKLNRIE